MYRLAGVSVLVRSPRALWDHDWDLNVLGFQCFRVCVG